MIEQVDPIVVEPVAVQGIVKAIVVLPVAFSFTAGPLSLSVIWIGSFAWSSPV